MCLRIHDLRHLHISPLIDIGLWAAEIIDRVGRENINIVSKALQNELNAICAVMQQMDSWRDANAEFKIPFRQILDMVNQMRENTDAGKRN